MPDIPQNKSVPNNLIYQIQAGTRAGGYSSMK